MLSSQGSLVCLPCAPTNGDCSQGNACCDGTDVCDGTDCLACAPTNGDCSHGNGCCNFTDSCNGTTCLPCVDAGESCAAGNGCCQNTDSCNAGVCCVPPGVTCTSDSDCCSPATCTAGACEIAQGAPCVTGADCASGCCAPAVNGAGAPVGPYVCKVQDWGAYDCCGFGGFCGSGYCCFTDGNQNEFCSAPCTSSSTCGGAQCQSYGNLSTTCTQTEGCGP